MGVPKQLLPWGKTNLINHQISQVSQVFDPSALLVVTGSGHELVEAAIPAQISRVCHKSWSKGLGSSIAFGLKALIDDQPGIKGVMVVLTDQPMIGTDHFKAILERFSEGDKWVVASSYAGKPGVPALFGIQAFQELLRLDGDRGAGPWMSGLKDKIGLIDISADLSDLDTMEDYYKAHLRMFGKLPEIDNNHNLSGWV